MTYTLELFSLPQKAMENERIIAETDANSIRNQGQSVGVIQFEQGEPHHFFEAIQQLVGIPVTTLLPGYEERRISPIAAQPSGGLSRPVTALAINVLKSMITNLESAQSISVIDESDAWVAVAKGFDLDPYRFLKNASLLCRLLQRAIQEGREPVTIYR